MRKYIVSKTLKNNKKGRVLTFVSMALAIIVSIFASSCQRDNNMGDMRGQWQILSIDYPDGTSYAPREPRLYMSFDQKILQLTTSDNDVAGDDGRYMGIVSGDEPDLTFSFPYNTTPATMLLIKRWGIDENPAQVKVEKLDGSQMRLKIGNNILTFRKF